MPRDFRPVREFGEWPALEAKGFDTRLSTFIPDNSIDTAKVRELDATRLTGTGIKVYNAAAANTITTATNTGITFDTTDFAQGFDTPSGATFTTVTIPYTGVYLALGNIEWAAGAGGRNVWLDVNGTIEEGDGRTNDAGSFATKHVLTVVRRFTAGDTLGLEVRQSSGGNLAVATGDAECALTAVFLFAI